MSYFTKPILISSILATFLLTGCGDSSTKAKDTQDSTVESTTITGQLVDSYVTNADYTCADGKTGITDVDGRFECDSIPVSFKLGGLKLGVISAMPSDKQIFPQDLLGADRNDTNNPNVIAMAIFLQSCDDDNNSQNGLKIRQNVKDSLSADEDFSADDIESYVEITVDEDSAIRHLTQTTAFTDAVNGTNIPQAIKDALLTSGSELTQEITNTLSYMGNEERLAYDVYNKMDQYFPEITQFSKIAENAEKQHILAMQLLIKKYVTGYEDLTNINLTPLAYVDTKIEDMNAGVYDISAIQELYNSLVTMGEESSQKALEVACMIEVTDINDLDADIILAEEANATDVVTVFNFLRDGSYSHYWAFDKGLINLGVSDGCCSLGDAYCHPEYPVNENQGSGEESGTGGGEGKQHGKH